MTPIFSRDRACELAERLRHETRLQTHVGVAHFAVQFGLGDERGDRVDDEHVDGAGADEGLGDFERLLAGVGLRDEEVVHVYTELFGVGGVESVLGIHERREAAVLLRLGDDLQCDGGFARGFRPEDLGDPAAGNAAHPQRSVEADGAGGDNCNRQKSFPGAKADNGTFAKLFFDLCECEFYGFGAVVGNGH
jgi:hypothetical protein